MLRMHQKQKPQLTASGSEFAFKYPRIDSHTPKGIIISVLKKKITQAQLRAQERRDAFGEGDPHYIDLKIAVAYAAQRLRTVIEREAERIMEREELMDGIRALDQALRRC